MSKNQPEEKKKKKKREEDKIPILKIRQHQEKSPRGGRPGAQPLTHSKCMPNKKLDGGVFHIPYFDVLEKNRAVQSEGFFWMCVHTGDRSMQGAKRSRTGDRGYPRTGGQDPGFAKLEMHRKNRGPTQRQKVGEKTGGRKNLMLKDPPASRKIAKGGVGDRLQSSSVGLGKQTQIQKVTEHFKSGYI